MGCNYLIGILIVVLLFGVLYQGGVELLVEFCILCEMVIVIQVLVILFIGVLDNMVWMLLEWMFFVLCVGKEGVK